MKVDETVKGMFPKTNSVGMHASAHPTTTCLLAGTYVVFVLLLSFRTLTSATDIHYLRFMQLKDPAYCSHQAKTNVFAVLVAASARVGLI